MSGPGRGAAGREGSPDQAAEDKKRGDIFSLVGMHGKLAHQPKGVPQRARQLLEAAAKALRPSDAAGTTTDEQVGQFLYVSMGVWGLLSREEQDAYWPALSALEARLSPAAREAWQRRGMEALERQATPETAPRTAPPKAAETAGASIREVLTACTLCNATPIPTVAEYQPKRLTSAGKQRIFLYALCNACLGELLNESSRDAALAALESFFEAKIDTPSLPDEPGSGVSQ
jgi:hypothetical protein